MYKHRASISTRNPLPQSIAMKNLTPNSLKYLTAALGLVLALLADHAGAALLYWDNNGTSTPGSGTWNTTSHQWATSSTLVASPPLYSNSTADAAAFSGGSAANSPTITLSTAVNAGGIFIEGGTTTVTIQGTGSI